MASDQQVSARAVLDAMMEIQRRGHRVREDLEQIEPDLARYLMESLSAVHGKLIDLSGPADETQRLYREIEAITLVCTTALRKGHYELWRQSESGNNL